MVPPCAGDFVDERLGAVAVLEHQLHRHVAARENQQQHCEGDQGQRPLRHGDGAHRPHHFDLAPQRQQHQHELISGEPGRQPQRRKAGFGDHFCERLPGLVLRREIAELGRHVALVMLGEDRVGDENAVLQPALGDRPLPSRNSPADAAIQRPASRLAVGHDETDRDAVGLVPDRALFHHAAETMRLTVGPCRRRCPPACRNRMRGP